LKWDILFNPTKSHLFTVGGSNPSASLHLWGKDLNWSSKVHIYNVHKYLGIYLLAGSGFRIELNAAKQKYYACFNNIRSVVRQQVNEIMLLKLVKTYCLPRLLYGFEIWPREAIDIKELNVMWNNGFRHIFNCCWRESVKPLQYFCQSLPLLYLTEERQVIFLNKLLYSDNCRHSVQYEILGLASKYGLNTVQNSKSMVKYAIWTCFKHEVHF